MSIPLIQKPEKDDINTSIIAIKRNIERINMLLGLVDTGGNEPDLSGFATKQELQDAVTELQPVDEVTIGNMQSVTSNAVAQSLKRELVITAPTLVGGGTYSIYKTGKVVELFVSGVTLSSGNSVNLLYLPVGLRPTYDFFALGQTGSGSLYYTTSMLVSIKTNGDVYIYTYDAIGGFKTHAVWTID